MNRKRILAILLTVLTLAATGSVAIASPVSAATTDMTSTITDFLPLIVTFAMLGMVLGLLKKFGKF